MRYIVLILIACFAWAEDQPLPTEAAKVVTEHDQIVAKAKAAYEAAVAKADAEAAKKLEPLLVKVTKSGDLNGANAIKDKMDGYKKNQGDLLGDNTFPVGKFSAVGNPSLFYIVNADRTWTSNYKNFAGTWSVQKNEVTFIANAGTSNQTFTVPLKKEADWVINSGNLTTRMRWEAVAAKPAR